jgi:hypothetical protein
MKKLNVLVISGLYPSRFNDMSGVFITRQAECLARHGVEFNFLTPRPWVPWPLVCIPRWRKYGSGNPLVGPEEFEARLAHYIRLPGAWFRKYEGRFMTASIRRKILA